MACSICVRFTSFYDIIVHDAREPCTPAKPFTAATMAEKSGADVTNPGDVMGMIKQYDFLSISLGGKIQCSLTNRDLPLRVDAIQQHLNSKKLKREREW